MSRRQSWQLSIMVSRKDSIERDAPLRAEVCPRATPFLAKVATPPAAPLGVASAFWSAKCHPSALASALAVRTLCAVSLCSFTRMMPAWVEARIGPTEPQEAKITKKCAHQYPRERPKT